MDSSALSLALDAARATADSLGLRIESADVLHNSNRIAVRLLPCDVLARVAPESHATGAEFEVEVSRRLAEAGAPVARLDPRVEPRAYRCDGMVVTLWTYYKPIAAQVPPAEFAVALQRLHEGYRQVDLPAPHFTNRVAEALQIVDDRTRSPELAGADREFLSSLLRSLQAEVMARGKQEQLLHGEPHPGNLLATSEGPLFIDLETCCRGPVEFDVVHAPEEVAAHYPGLDAELLRTCRTLSRALVAAWRWDRFDEFPDGREMGVELLAELRKPRGLGIGTSNETDTARRSGDIRPEPRSLR